MHDELTANDIKKMEDEIEYRKLVVRKKALDDVKVARAQGDLSENFEYKAAKQFKNQNESRIRYLEKMIKTAVVISDESKDDEVGMFNTVEGLIFFHIAFQTGFCTLFLRNFIKELPYELFEAARVEGATEWQLFYKIVLPLIAPALAALAILVFTFVWNDYFWALCLTQGDEAAPITVGVAALKGQWTTAWNLVSAGSLLAALPSVLMFFAMQKHFVAGLTFGATKG